MKIIDKFSIKNNYTFNSRCENVRVGYKAEIDVDGDPNHMTLEEAKKVYKEGRPIN
ncbi:hypothetical protein [Ligilactobacillus salivarius]|uniref:hypothetical protein n=1 Tax=Ligilactobacillus salivarius TaxID=1624 RepID=UPI0015D7DE32|nr:hypothetical protein [Ligilactobacillus salivarius]